MAVDCAKAHGVTDHLEALSECCVSLTGPSRVPDS